jgi:L-asparaginase II
MNSGLLAEVTRNGCVENRHHGSVVVLSPNGGVLLSIGSPNEPNFGRSANKMMQAVAMLRLGVELTDEQVALATASHSGGPEHLRVVTSILDRYGLSESDLGNVAMPPIGDAELVNFVRSGDVASALTMNCSGKHAAMLATCDVQSWDRSGYLEVDHPLQRAMTAAIIELTREPSAGVGIDGCGAPAHLVSLVGLARSLSEMAMDDESTHGGRVASAIRRFPILVGGRGRDVTEFLLAAPGWIGKDGADGGMVLASPDGFTVALKIEDGASVPRIPVAIAALEHAGIALPVLPALMRNPAVFGGGVPVGEVRAVMSVR